MIKQKDVPECTRTSERAKGLMLRYVLLVYDKANRLGIGKNKKSRDILPARAACKNRRK
jgi:hypothetical protein